MVSKKKTVHVIVFFCFASGKKSELKNIEITFLGQHDESIKKNKYCHIANLKRALLKQGSTQVL